MATENLKVKITADASQAKAEIGKFKNSLKDTVGAAEDATASVTKFKGALAALAAVKVAKAMVKNAISVAAAGDSIKDNAQKVFMGTTAYQEWGYVLEQNGVNMSALKMGMRKFSQEVATGSDTLSKYGITATDVDTAFQQAIYTIQNMSSESERIAAATELFGSRALELFPILNLTNAETQNLMASYRALGGTMSNELIAASDTCTDSITAMKAAWGGLRNVLAAYVIPVVTKVVQWITVAIAKVGILLAAILGIKESYTSGGKKSLPAATASVAKNTGGTANNLKKATKHAKELRRTMMGIDELSRLTEKATSGTSGGSGGGVGGGSIGDVGVGDAGSFDGIISDETMNKLGDFKEKIEEIQPILNGVYLIMKGLVEISLGNPIQGFSDLKTGVEKLLDPTGKLREKWDELKESIKEKVTSAISIVQPKWADLKTKWRELLGKFKGKTESVKLKIGTTWSSLKSKWKKLIGNFKSVKRTITLNIKTKFSNVKSWINSHVIGPLNNKMHRVFPGVSVPYLAKGGILTTPTAAVLGEYAGARSNPEIATPQSLMYETIQRANGDLISAFATMTRQVIMAIEDKDLAVRIGDEQIARSAQRGNTSYKNRTGKALLTI